MAFKKKSPDCPACGAVWDGNNLKHRLGQANEDIEKLKPFLVLRKSI